MWRLTHTWKLMGASWEVLKKDKELLVFPLISGICCLLVIAAFAIPLFQQDGIHLPNRNAPAGDQIEQYAFVFFFYFCNYFVIAFFNSAVIACAVIRMKGGDPTVRDGLRAASSRIVLIAEWVLVAATVGLILRIIEDRSKLVGKIMVSVIGTVWSLASFLVVPVLVIERIDPIGAVKESTRLLKKTWGEQMVGNFSFGLIFFILSIPGGILMLVGLLSGNATYLVTLMGLGALYLILLALIQTGLQAIFQAALYLYAKGDQVPIGFQSELLMDAISRRSSVDS